MRMGGGPQNVCGAAGGKVKSDVSAYLVYGWVLNSTCFLFINCTEHN